MKLKTFILLLMLSSVMLSGCTDNKTTNGSINTTDNVSNISTENVTTDTTNVISLNESEQNVTTTTEETAIYVPAANVSTEDTTTTTTGPYVVDTGVPRTFTVRLEKFLSSPSTLVVAPKDTVYWTNFNDPKRLFVLVSEDGLWENRNIGYRESFGYTFNETGTFNYSITGFPRMGGTIIVK